MIISGWEMMDPFVPIEVQPYSKGELNIMIDYFYDKGYDQLRFLSVFL